MSSNSSQDFGGGTFEQPIVAMPVQMAANVPRRRGVQGRVPPKPKPPPIARKNGALISEAMELFRCTQTEISRWAAACAASPERRSYGRGRWLYWTLDRLALDAGPPFDAPGPHPDAAEAGLLAYRLY